MPPAPNLSGAGSTRLQGGPGSTWNISALPTGAGRAAAQRLGGRALRLSPSPPTLAQSPGGISPSRGSRGRAGGVGQRASTHHPVWLWQLLLSNPNTATTAAWRQIASRPARELWRRARSACPAGASALLCLGECHEIELPGRAKRQEAALSKGVFQDLPSQEAGGAGDSSAPWAAEEPAVPALLLPPA